MSLGTVMEFEYWLRKIHISKNPVDKLWFSPGKIKCLSKNGNVPIELKYQRTFGKEFQKKSYINLLHTTLLREG